MKLIPTSIIFSVLMFTAGCNSEKKKDVKSDEKKTDTIDTTEPNNTEEINQDWIDVQSKVSRMTTETNYNQIIELLGKPYEEYPSPSLPEEYVLFYNVPGVNGAIFWLTINAKTKTFLYWSGEKNEK